MEFLVLLDLMRQKTVNGPLSHIRILDLSRVLAGPWAAQNLADLGANVIKVERPGEGDDTRKWGHPYLKDRDGQETRETAYNMAANRNKRSVTIDMAKPEGASLVRQLALKSDILIENFRVGGATKFGLGYQGYLLSLSLSPIPIPYLNQFLSLTYLTY